MKVVDNKFEIGEECYTYARESMSIPCPVCNGTKKITYNGYEIKCKQCDFLGQVTTKQTVVSPHKVKVNKIVANILDDSTTVKYKVSTIGEYTGIAHTNIRNRSESCLFKTLEECEEKCKDINLGKASEF